MNDYGLACDPSVDKATENGWMIMVFIFIKMSKIKSKTIFSESVEASGWGRGHPIWSNGATKCASVVTLITEHLLRGAALLLQVSRLVLDRPSWLLALRLHVLTLLSTFHHGGHLVAFSRHHWPPGQTWRFELVSNGVDQRGHVDEVGNRLGSGVGGGATGAHRLGYKFGLPVVQHSRATDGVKGHSEDGIVQGEGPVARCQVAHGYGLQAGELGGRTAADRCDGDVA